MFLVPEAGDVEDMAKNVLYILKDEDTHNKFRAAALENAKMYSLEKILPLYEDYYRKVIDSSVYSKT